MLVVNNKNYKICNDINSVTLICCETRKYSEIGEYDEIRYIS